MVSLHGFSIPILLTQSNLKSALLFSCTCPFSGACAYYIPFRRKSQTYVCAFLRKCKKFFGVIHNCGSQRGKAKIVAYMVWGNSYKEQPDRINPARLKESYIKVFSSSRGAKPRTPRSKAEYDFATVDVREELCYHSLTEKANSEEIILLLECKKTNVISLEALHPYFSKNYRIWCKNSYKNGFLGYKTQKCK